MAEVVGEVRYEFMRPQQILAARARAPVAYPRYATVAQGRQDVASEVRRISQKVRDALAAVAGVPAGQP